MALLNRLMPGEWDYPNQGGLLGGLTQKLENPLLQFGLGILANNQGNYGAFAPAFGKGGMMALQNLQQINRDKQRQELFDLEKQRMERELKKQKDSEDAMGRLLEGEGAYVSNQQVPVTSFENVPVAPQEGAVAPNFNLQRQEVTTMQEQPTFDNKRYMGDLVAAGLGDNLLQLQIAERFKKPEPIKLGKGERLIDPRTNKELIGALDDPADLPSAVREYEYAKGQGYQGTFQQFQIEQKRAGASRTNVNVSTDKKYGEIFGSKMAEQDAAYIDAAKTAPDRVASARRVQEILDKNPTTGTGAEARLGIEKAFATAGLIDGENVKNTEDLAAELASATLDAIKTSGLGSGQGFTDKDRQFLERARSGNIEVNAQTLRRLAHLNEMSAIRSIERGNAVIRKLKTDPSLGDVAGRLEEIPLPGASSATVQPPKQAINALRMNPKLRDQFDQKYGPGAAAKVLGRK